MMQTEPDTIYAPATPPGRAAIAIIRLSGPASGPALAALVGGLPPPRLARYVRVRDPDSGETLDAGLALWFPGPRSATGENVAELHLHGSRAVLGAVMAVLRRRGLRVAEPGEFTRRAFLNGKLDLTQAEAVADLAAAETEAQRLAALAGGLGGDQIGEALGLGEVEAAPLEGAPGELAGLGRPEAERDQGVEHAGRYRAAAMQVQLGHVLAGEGGGAGQPEHEGAVELLAAVAERAQAGPPRRRPPARQRVERLAGAGAGEADDGDGGAGRAGRQREDRSRLHLSRRAARAAPPGRAA